jgi:hypothetical protein
MSTPTVGFARCRASCAYAAPSTTDYNLTVGCWINLMAEASRIEPSRSHFGAREPAFLARVAPYREAAPGPAVCIAQSALAHHGA